MTEDQRFAAAYMMGKFRQQSNLSITLIVINIIIMFVMKGTGIGFNIAMLLISATSFWANHSSLRRLEKNYILNEGEMISTTILLQK